MEAGGKIEKEHANSVIVDRTQQFLKELGAAAPQALHTTFPLSKLSEKMQKKGRIDCRAKCPRSAERLYSSSRVTA